MRLKMTALVASAVSGLLYITMPSASALPAVPRADTGVAAPSGLAEQVHWRRWGWGPRYYRPYAYYGYGPYYYRPYRYYRPHYYRRWGWRHRGW